MKKASNKKLTSKSTEIAADTKGQLDAIKKQFHQIQKRYKGLLEDVTKELNLIKKWIDYGQIIKK